MDRWGQALVPGAAGLVSTALAVLVLRRYLARPAALHHLFWGIGLVMYAVGGWTEVHRAFFGFTPAGFRLWYLSGAVLVAAYLGQGTAYLLLRRRAAHVLAALLVAGSVFAGWRVMGASLDPSLAQGLELTGRVIVSPGVRVLTPFFNVYGTLLLVGGAAYSAWQFYRRGGPRDRMVGNVLIAAGGLAPAIGGTLSRFGLPGLYVGELVGAVLLYAGFLRASASRAPAPAGVEAGAAARHA